MTVPAPEEWGATVVVDAWDCPTAEESWELGAVADERWELVGVDNGSWEAAVVTEAWETTGTPAALFTETIVVAPTPGLGGDSGYVHEQASASTTWTINHNLGRRVDVAVTDLGGSALAAAVQATSLNQVVVSFNAAQAGYAIIH